MEKGFLGFKLNLSLSEYKGCSERAAFLISLTMQKMFVAIMITFCNFTQNRKLINILENHSIRFLVFNR